MTKPMTNDEIIERLAAHRTLGAAPREELAWLAAHGTLRQLNAGELVAHPSEVIDGTFIVLSGRISIHVDRGTGRRKVMEWRGGDVTGLLPYSRLLRPPGETTVEEPTELLEIPRADMRELIRNCYEVTAILVHVMTDRTRRFTSSDLRDEKMISLGKLASGLAHELNNPASAAMRDAKLLGGALTAAEEAARALSAAGLTEAQLGVLDAVRGLCMSSTHERRTSGLALADREEAFAEWLDAHGLNAGSAEELAKTPATIEALDRLASVLQGKTLESALNWIGGGCAARALVFDIERSATRIHDLVAAVKGFTHMDRAPVLEPVDIPRGLADTVAILDGKARARSVKVTLTIQPGLPAVKGISAEINQIWMNLIDNAIDAAPEHGHVTVTAATHPTGVMVRIEDDGPGIAQDVKESIFEPFFTTKSVGKGTGLGLDIVRRIVDWHNADIDVESRPGHTEFRVRFRIGGRDVAREEDS
jgi:signal transduction histidine kinase